MLLPEIAPPTAVTVIGLWLSLLEQGSVILEAARCSPGDPVNRVKYELALGLAMLTSRDEGNAVELPEAQNLTTDEALELVSLQLKRAHWENEWQAFVASWHDSIAAPEKTGLARFAIPWAVVDPI